MPFRPTLRVGRNPPPDVGLDVRLEASVSGQLIALYGLSDEGQLVLARALLDESPIGAGSVCCGRAKCLKYSVFIEYSFAC